MSLALPIAARSETGQSADARLAGLVVAAVAVGLMALAAYSPKVLGDGDTWSQPLPAQAISAADATVYNSNGLSQNIESPSRMPYRAIPRLGGIPE